MGMATDQRWLGRSNAFAGISRETECAQRARRDSFGGDQWAARSWDCGLIDEMARKER